MEKIFTSIRKIYSALGDDISKKIFIAQLNFSVTGEVGFVRELPMRYRNLNADIELFSKNMKEHGADRLVVFGAGANGVDLVRVHNNLSFFCFVDNYKKETIEETTGVPIYSFSEYKMKYGIANTKFIIAVYRKDFVRDIFHQLTENGVGQKDILYIADWRNNNSQYFDLFVPHEHETFVDCGCYDGSTAFRFAGWCAEGGFTYDYIWSFEPDERSYEKCKQTLQFLANCSLYPYGISDKNETVSFMANGYENAKIVKGNSINQAQMRSVEVKCLDEFLRNERITFIKMDIEGAEYDALRGASSIIKEQKPRLAISIYHKADHIVLIPELLLTIRPDYKFYIRHYSLLANEIVLYAE